MGTPFSLLSNVSSLKSNLSFGRANSESYDMRGGRLCLSKMSNWITFIVN